MNSRPRVSLNNITKTFLVGDTIGKSASNNVKSL